MGTHLSPKRGTALRSFGPCLLWPNGWMDQDATWYGGRPRSRPHCVRWRPSPTSFRPMSIVAKRLPISATAELLFKYNAVYYRHVCNFILLARKPILELWIKSLRYITYTIVRTWMSHVPGQSWCYFRRTLTYLIAVHERNRQTDRITMVIPRFTLKCIVR